MIFAPFFLHLGARQSPASPAVVSQSEHVWVKSISPGLTLRTEWNTSTPLIIYALKINTHCPDVSLGCDLAGQKVYANNSTLGRGTVTEIVRETKAFAGVNGDFFPFTGQPLNLMVRNGEILSLPYQPAAYPDAHRGIFAWGPGKASFGYASTRIGLKVEGKEVPITGFNQEAVPSALTLDNASAGLAYAKSANSYALLQVDHDKWKPDDTIVATVKELGSNVTKTPVKAGTAYLVGNGTLAATVQKLKPGQKISITFHTTGFDWSQFKNAVGGAPILFKEGEANMDPKAEMISSGFSDQTHPRTAIGTDDKGNIWLVAVDGRTSSSAGVSLTSLARIMKGLGCTNAMNLDGGGSTTLNVLGLTLNHPSDGVERAVAEGVLVFAPIPKSPKTRFVVDGPKSIAMGESAAYRVFVGGNSRINSDVIWKGSGAGWVDQAGVLHPTRTGTAVVSALVDGVISQFKVTVTGKQK